jgi:Ca2+-binding EF-hand superfamily protein
MFKVMFHTERASECLRSRIAKRANFSLEQAFSYADKNKDGVITSNEVRDILAEHGFFATEKELLFIMAKFDKDRDQKISYSEFIQEMTPRNVL